LRIYALTLSLLGIFFAAIAYGRAGGEEILSADERAWLTQNQPRIVLAVETGYAPFVFIDSHDQPTGLAHDYIRLIESKLGVHFNQRRFSSLDEIFQKVRSGEVHIVNAVTSTPARTKFLSMTTPFISVPNVIIVRKERSGQISEFELFGLRISLVNSYAITEYMTSRGLHFIPDIVPDDLSSLLNVSFGRTDAAIIDLATATYLISEKGIANLRVAGEVAYDVRLSMATHLDDTMLNGILQKGLDAITEPERLEIKERWITALKPQSIFKDRQFWIVLGSVVAAALVIFAAILAWNRTLRQQIILRRNAEESFKAAFQYSRSLIEASLDPMVTISAEGKITDVNAATEQVTGASRDSLIGSDFADYFTDPEKARAVYRQVFSRDGVKDYPLAIRHVSGKITDVLYNANLYRDDNGNVLGVFAAARDVTEHKLSETAIRQSNEEQTAIFESATSGIAFIKNRIIVKGNRTLDHLFGFEAGEQAGLSTRHWYVDDEAYEVGGTPYAALARGEIHQREQQLVRKDGTKFWCHFSGSAIEVGNLSRGTVWMLTNVTHEHDTAEALLQAKDTAEAANRAKSEFLANMSHEIRTPLNGLIGNAQLLEMSKLDGEQKEYLSAMMVSGHNLLSLINDILDLSKIEAEKVVLEKADFSLRGCIKDVIRTQRSRIANKGLALNLVVQNEAPDALIGDELRVKQILLNFLGNAIKFTKAGGITVSATVRERSGNSALIELAVADTGIGIPKAVADDIFKPFVQADSSMTRRYGGSGLGLAISRRLAELMDGSISVESEEGVGSIFRALLPFPVIHQLAQEQGAPAAEAPTALWTGAPLKVLLAEDNEINKQFSVALLKKMGHQFEVAENGKEALAALEAAAFDLVLMDIQMPVMDGHEALAVLRERERSTGAHLPVIALTAHALKGEEEGFLAAGFDGYVSKPLEVKKLVAEMKRVLELKQTLAMN